MWQCMQRLRSGARKHYNMQSVLRGIFWNATQALPFMWGSLRLAPINIGYAYSLTYTTHTYVHVHVHVPKK